jgi:hypothetical protein
MNPSSQVHPAAVKCQEIHQRLLHLPLMLRNAQYVVQMQFSVAASVEFRLAPNALSPMLVANAIS